MPLNVLIIGATRGLGLSLANHYASSSASNIVYGTTRSPTPPTSSPTAKINPSINWLTNIDLLSPSCPSILVNQLGTLGVGGRGRLDPASGTVVTGFDIVIISAGYFQTETWGRDVREGGLNWDAEIKMYTTSSVAPPLVVHALDRAHMLNTSTSTSEDPGAAAVSAEEKKKKTKKEKGSCKILLVSSESGSIALRHATEGGGNYGHHASKSALNMVGRLLALDLEEKGVVVSIVHPGFMRTEMTRGVGFDKFWDEGGAVTPDVAAGSLVRWVEDLTLGMSGQYWAPRGRGDIGTWESVFGKEEKEKEEEEGPVELPW